MPLTATRVLPVLSCYSLQRDPYVCGGPPQSKMSYGGMLIIICTCWWFGNPFCRWIGRALIAGCDHELTIPG